MFYTKDTVLIPDWAIVGKSALGLLILLGLVALFSSS